MVAEVILTKVVLTDYGIYRGRNEFELSCKQERPLILFGGSNGAGKTTLFESVMLCLYGMAALERRTTKKTYERLLEDKIHRRREDAAMADQASVEVQFKFFHNGQEVEYRVERSWRAGGVDERLDVWKRSPGQESFGPLDAVERPHWQQFIEGIIPRGIMRLFFFDGEKIVKMARDGTEDATIRESFKSLLGLDLIEQLRADLQINLTRNLAGDGRTLREDFDRLKAERDESGRAIERLRERLAQKQTEMDTLQTEIEAAEAVISGLGGGFASRRAEVKEDLATIRAKHEAACQRIRDLCADALPFSLIPARLARMHGKILEDDEIQRKRAGQDLLDSKLDTILTKLGARAFGGRAGLDHEGSSRAASLVSKVVEGERWREALGEPALGLSPKQSSRMLHVMNLANGDMPDRLQEHAAVAAESAERISRLESELASAPQDDEIGPLVSKVGRLHAQAGTNKVEMDHIEERISYHVALRGHLNSKIRDIMSQIYKKEQAQRGVDLTRRVQKVLEEFAGTLRTKQVHLLERYLLEAAGTLMHKTDLVGGVRIDPDTFEISLYGKGGSRLPKGTLSEGEKQMFATAVLWALAKTSGRPLPFMIDTPLARLDAMHRNSIVERFLPAASHQVLVFSTDTEIREAEYGKLRPYLTRSYVMEYSREDNCTRRRDGYFWDAEGGGDAAV